MQFSSDSSKSMPKIDLGQKFNTFVFFAHVVYWQRLLIGMKSLGWQNSIRALRNRNYRLFFFGQSVSLIGSWMHRIALAWLVYRLSNSTFLLGAVEFAGQIPAFLLTPIAGVFLDRWNRRRVVMVTQTLSLMQALLMALLVMTHWVRVEHVIVLAGVLGLINAFDMPARHALVLDMLGSKEHLGNAIALNSFLFNSARFIGPSLAGMLIAAAGEGICFLVNAGSFLAIIIALYIMTTQQAPRVTAPKRISHELIDGLNYCRHHRAIKVVLLTLSVMSLVGLPYTVLMPAYTREVLHGDSRTLGFLIGGVGVGALIGAVFLASRTGVHGLPKIIFAAIVSSGVGFLIIGLVASFYSAVILAGAVGFGIMVLFASGNTLVQTLVDDDKRGRVMSIYTMTFLGMNPLGALAAGAVAQKWGVALVMVFGGCICLLTAVWYAMMLKRIPKQAFISPRVFGG